MKNTIVSFCKDARVRSKLNIINLFVLISIFMLMGCRIIPIETFAICIFFINSVRSAIESIAYTDEEILKKNSLLCVVLTNYQFTFYVMMFIYSFIFYSINCYCEEISSTVGLLILFMLFIVPILPIAISMLFKKILKK